MTNTVDTIATPVARELHVRQEEPFNAGTPLALLGREYVTPAGLFFVRSHGNVPAIDAAAYRLTVTGLVERPLTLSLDELRARFVRHEITATLQCAGNRRAGLSAVRSTSGVLQWDADAIGNAVWSGVRLAEVLHDAGVRPQARHAAFEGADGVMKVGEPTVFGGSIPLDKALSEDVLLAFEMNGDALPPAHGYPVRVVVPGYIGARSVKWVRSVTLQAVPSANIFQRRDYQLFPGHVTVQTARFERGMMLGEASVNSVITEPAPETTVPAGVVSLRGYAFAGGGRTVVRVEVTTDGGASWTQADLLAIDDSPWAWRLWRADVPVSAGAVEVAVRAWDSAANTQPEHAAAIWNFAGYMNNSWHRVRLTARG